MKRIALVAALAFASSTAFAMHCPKDMAAIDAALAKKPKLTADQMKDVKKYRAEGEAPALLAPNALDQGLIGIDDQEAAAGIDKGRVGEAQGEVVRLANEQDQIGLAQDLGEGAQPRIVDAAWAFHRHDGNTELVL